MMTEKTENHKYFQRICNKICYYNNAFVLIPFNMRQDNFTGGVSVLSDVSTRATTSILSTNCTQNMVWTDLYL